MKKGRGFDIVVITATGLLSIACLMVYLFRFSGGLSDSQELFGQFGDYIGGVIGTIVSFLSLVYIYKTYKRQVEFSSREIRLSYKQQFESSLFSLIQHHQTLCQTISSINEGPVSFFDKVAEELQERMMEREYDLGSITYENRFTEEDIASDIYNEVYNKYGNQLSHYFRSLYHVFSYVDKSDVDDKKQYIDIIQGQLSNSELYVLFYNGISRYGKRKLYPLLEKYGVLENLFYSDFGYFPRHQSLFYPKTTFKYNIDTLNSIVFLGGIHCSGKNTLCSLSLTNMPVEHLSASQLLKWSEISAKENKKVQDINYTQNRLIEGLRRTIEFGKKYILDGHFCLLDKNGNISKVPFETFRAINPSGIIVLTDAPNQIAKRLKARDRVEYSSRLIHDFQQEELKYSQEIANTLHIPYLVLRGSMCSSKDFLVFIKDVLKINDSSF